MVRGLTSLLVLVGVPHGAVSIRHTSHLRSATSVHCHLLGRRCSDHLLRRWGKFKELSLDLEADKTQLHSTLLTLLASIIQLVALVWYLVSYFPMGSQGLRFAARVGGGRVAAWMNG